MNVNEYQKQAMATLNPALNRKDVLINSVMGLCGESGEAIDIVKKWLAQGHALDKDHLAKELGDIAWYLAEAATALDLSLEEILQANIDKLKNDTRMDLKRNGRSFGCPVICKHRPKTGGSGIIFMPEAIYLWFFLCRYAIV